MLIPQVPKREIPPMRRGALTRELIRALEREEIETWRQRTKRRNKDNGIKTAETKMAAKNILVSIGVERLRNIAWSFINNEEFHIPGLKIHIEKLALNLAKVHSLLPDAETKGTRSEIVRNWLEKVAVISSETEILLDEFAYQNLRFGSEVKDEKQKKVLDVLSSSNTILVTTRLICKTKRINSNYESLFCKAVIFGVVPVENMVCNDITFEETRETSDEGGFGIREDLKGIIDALINVSNDKDLPVCSILVKEGVGNTNLANLVLQNEAVLRKFGDGILIHASENFVIDDVLKQMIKTLTGTPFDASKREAIIFKLIEMLNGRKFLLVLDDLQQKAAMNWHLFMNNLKKVGGLKGSKILVITRTDEVTRLVESYYVHKLEGRRPEDIFNSLGDASALSKDRAFKTPKLAKLCKEIFARCGGVPLLLKLKRTFLCSKKDENQWLKIAQDNAWNQVRGVQEEQMFEIMKLCYDHLPSLSLKQCFAFCAIFPKDSVIRKQELLHLWMAHGLLYPPTGQHLNSEDRGSRYLDILFRHSLLQDCEDDESHKSEVCQMPRLLHNLALLMSKGLCSIMQDTVVKDGFQAVHVTMMNCKLHISENLRRSLEKLRTLRLIDTGVLGALLPYTKNLCALTVVGSDVEELPGSIGRLKYLKLLDISETQIVKLPETITKLYGLEILRLYDLQELPKNFDNLVCLRHFYIKTFEDFGRLNFLPLKYHDLIKHSSFKASFKACLSTEFGIEKLASLEHPDRYSSLRIYRLENVKDNEEATKANLSRMTKIQYLKLHWSARRENSYDENVLEGLKPHTYIKHFVVENFKGSKFPFWMVTTTQPLLRNLVTIELESCCQCDEIPPLGHLPCLQIVRIRGMDNVKQIGAEFYGVAASSSDSASSSSLRVFESLKELTLVEMTSLEQWVGVPHLFKKTLSFPVLEKFEVENCPRLTCLPDILNSKLRRLEIAFCDKLNSLPNGLQNLESLEDLEIRGVPSLSQLSIRCGNKLTSLIIGDFSSASGVDFMTQNTLPHLNRGEKQVPSLPGELQRFSNLINLTIWGYDGLKDLPDWLVSFQHLRDLKLEFCKSLMHFPSADTMRKLAELDKINISFCPLLEERCIRGSRPEWHKISHIRNIIINNDAIKSQI